MLLTAKTCPQTAQRVPFHTLICKARSEIYGMIVPRLYEVFEQIGYWVDHQTFPPDEIAIRFHHALVVVHPFPNGNGRWSRLMGGVLASCLGQPIFTWSGGALADAEALRAQYIRAQYIEVLQAADAHDFGPPIDFARH